MKGKRIIEILIIISIILFIFLLIILFNIINNTNNDDDTLIQEEIQNTIDNIDHNDYDNSVYYEQNGILYSTSGEPKDGIDFEIKNVPDEVFNYIKNEKAFYATIRTYAFTYRFYKNANIAEFNRYEYNKELDKLAIEFTLNDDKKTKFISMVNLKDETMEIIK